MRIDDVFECVENRIDDLEILDEAEKPKGSMTPDIEKGKEKRSVTRQFKRYGNKMVRQYRCMSGARKGRWVKNPKTCGVKKDPKQVRAGKQASRRKMGQRVRHTKLAKRRPASQSLQRYNKRLRGEKQR